MSDRITDEKEVADLREQLAAAQSSEVCTVAHSDEVMEFCPYCKIERLRGDLSETRIALANAECREGVAKARLEEAERERLTAARALVKAFNELNAIRARDGVPRDYTGMRVGVDEEYFSSVVDDVDAAVLALTGLGAHCHPLLYERATGSASLTQESKA